MLSWLHWLVHISNWVFKFICKKDICHWLKRYDIDCIPKQKGKPKGMVSWTLGADYIAPSIESMGMVQ